MCLSLEALELSETFKVTWNNCESRCKHRCDLIYSVRDGKSVQCVCVHWGSGTHTVRATESSQAVSVYTNVTLTDTPTHTHTRSHTKWQAARRQWWDTLSDLDT